MSGHLFSYSFSNNNNKNIRKLIIKKKNKNVFKI